MKFFLLNTSFNDEASWTEAFKPAFLEIYPTEHSPTVADPFANALEQQEYNAIWLCQYSQG